MSAYPAIHKKYFGNFPKFFLTRLSLCAPTGNSTGKQADPRREKYPPGASNARKKPANSRPFSMVYIVDSAIQNIPGVEFLNPKSPKCGKWRASIGKPARATLIGLPEKPEKCFWDAACANQEKYE